MGKSPRRVAQHGGQPLAAIRDLQITRWHFKYQTFRSMVLSSTTHTLPFLLQSSPPGSFPLNIKHSRGPGHLPQPHKLNLWLRQGTNNLKQSSAVSEKILNPAVSLLELNWHLLASSDDFHRLYSPLYHQSCQLQHIVDCLWPQLQLLSQAQSWTQCYQFPRLFDPYLWCQLCPGASFSFV